MASMERHCKPDKGWERTKTQANDYKILQSKWGPVPWSGNGCLWVKWNPSSRYEANKEESLCD